MNQDDTAFFKTPVERILENMEETFGDDFRGYYDGLMDDIPESLLPCIMASSIDIDTSSANTAQDRLDENITIVVAINKKDHIGVMGETNLADKYLRNIVIGQDPSTGQYLEQTVMNILRTRFTLDHTIVDNLIRIEFSPNERGEKVFTQEAFITLTVRRNVLVSRQ